MSSSVVVPVLVVLIVLAAVIGLTEGARRRGYRLGLHTIVRCNSGHLFTTIWVPGVSFKAARLGAKRFEHCPVGHHWTIVRPVKEADLTDEDRRVAGEHHDFPIP